MNHEDVVNDIKAMLEGAEPPVSSDCCIYRAPFDIRRLNEDAYTPKVVSIGPFHHHRHHRLQSMERHKLIYCKAFLQRANASLDTFVRYIGEVEPNFRCCYSETLELSKEELVKKEHVIDAATITAGTENSMICCFSCGSNSSAWVIGYS